METEIYITGTCIISNKAIIINGEKVYENLSTDVSGFLLSVYQYFHLSYPKFYKMDNLSKIGWLAAELLLKNFNKATYQPEEIGVVLANKNSSLDNDLKYFHTITDVASPSLFVYTLPNIVIGEICIRHNFKGEHAFFIQEEFDAVFLEKQVSYILDNDILQACICGWIDVLEQNHKAVLFLVEKHKSEEAALFTQAETGNIFNLF